MKRTVPILAVIALLVSLVCVAPALAAGAHHKTHKHHAERHHKAKPSRAHRATVEPTEYERCHYNTIEKEEECEPVTLEQLEAMEASGEAYTTTPEEEVSETPEEKAWFAQAEAAASSS